jgi:hypothetical protein
MKEEIESKLMLPKNKNCHTCRVREENCGEAKRLSPAGWTRHNCALWFPRDDMRASLLESDAKNRRNYGDK